MEAGARELLHLLEPTPEGFRQKQDVSLLAPVSDQLGPHVPRHLVRSVATKAAEPKPHVVLDQPLPRPYQRSSLRPRPVVDLGQISPDRDLARVRGIDRGR